MNFARFLQQKTAGPSLRRSLQRFLGDRAGTTAIEFAMISVPFIGLIGAILETGVVYFRTAQLQAVTESASRIFLTHNAASQTNQQFINANICTWKTQGVVKKDTLSTSFDCEKILMDVHRAGGAWANDILASGSDIYGVTYNPGAQVDIPAAQEVAIVRIIYPMPVLAGVLGGSALGQSYTRLRNGQIQFDSKWVHMLVGMKAFRVEPN